MILLFKSILKELFWFLVQLLKKFYGIARGQTTPALLFFPVNKVGLGHLSRLLAIAQQVKKIDTEIDILFVTACPCVSILHKAGIRYRHLPDRDSLPHSTLPSYWDRVLIKRLVEIFDECSPAAIVFDGPVPYMGINRATFFRRGLKKIWVRRKQRSEHLEKFAERGTWFDRIVEPGELDSKSNETFPPVISVARDDALSRDEARRKLGLSGKKKIVYLQLGSDARPIVRKMLDFLQSYFASSQKYYLVVAVSPLSSAIPDPPPGGVILQDYPNARYFKGIDLAISAAGYNTFHELLHFGVPTIFIPNEDTIADDQLARAESAVKAGAALMVREILSDVLFTTAIKEAVNEIEYKGREISSAAENLVPQNGAVEIAREILSMVKAGS